MFYAARQNQNRPTFQAAKSINQQKVQKALSIVLLMSVITIGLFLTGIVVPSFLRSGMASNNDLAIGSIHTLTIGGVTFTYTLQNLGAAILGGLIGSLIALVIEFPATLASAARNFLAFLQTDWKGFPRQSGRPSGIGNRKLA